MQIIGQFRIHLERLGYADNTVLMVPALVKSFLEYQFTNQKTNQTTNQAIDQEINQEITTEFLNEVTPKDILDFYDYLDYRPNKRRPGALSESYIGHHVYALRLFFDWLETRGLLRENPISGLTFKKKEYRPRQVLTIAEVEILYDACQSYKERAVLAIFYGCGLRRSEGEKLDATDIHFRSNLLYVRSGKGSKRRAVPLSETVKKDLLNYAYKERPQVLNQTAFVINKRGHRTSGTSHNKILKEILSRTTIEKQITLHNLRHSIATHLLESGLSVEYVRDFLGHKHLESTQGYTRVRDDQLWEMNK